MPSQTFRTALAAEQRRLRDAALSQAKDAVRTWRAKREDRNDLAGGMLLLLGEIAGDADGDDTLDVCEAFENTYWTVLTRTDEGCEVAIAVGRLTTEAKLLNRIVRGALADMTRCIGR